MMKTFMHLKGNPLHLGIFSICVFLAGVVHAQVSPSVSETSTLENTVKPTEVPKKKSNSARSSSGEKETEGTQARNQFSKDTDIPKSQYQFNGEPLEVDPD